ncbi:MAG: hypothetical protein ABI560_02040 [Myxococcales bacterium]
MSKTVYTVDFDASAEVAACPGEFHVTTTFTNGPARIVAVWLW